MASENSNVAPINIVSHVHPDNRRDFRANSIPKSVIKQAKAKIGHVCEVCATEETADAKLLRCGKCKTARYCSKKCQKEQWPTHKKVCREVDSVVSKFAPNLIANPLLSLYIQVALVLHYNLHKNPRPDSPMVARCDLSIIPSDLTYLVRGQTGIIPTEELEKGTEGMLQIESIRELDPRQSLDSTRMEMWRSTKQALKDRGRPSEHVVVVYFYLLDAAQGTAVSLPICREAIERVDLGEGFDRKSAILPTIKLPLNIDNCLTFINTHIRSDKRNQLSFRTHMSKEEVEKYFVQSRSRNTSQ